MLCKEKRKTPLVCLFETLTFVFLRMDMFVYVCALFVCVCMSVFVIIYYEFVGVSERDSVQADE